MKKITLMLGLILPVLGYSQGSCATAEPVTPGVENFLDAYTGELPTDFDCTEYGPDPGAPDYFQSGANWYSYTATVDGVAIVSSSQDDFPENTGLDTRVIVYSGACGDLVCEASNDDVVYPGNTTSAVAFAVRAGDTFYIVWDDAWTDVAGFTWMVDELEADCTTSFPYEFHFDDPLTFLGCFETLDEDGNGISWISQQDLDLDGDMVPETFATNGSNGGAGAVAKDDWLFSPAFTMTAGNQYEISYSYNAFSNTAGVAANGHLTSYIVNETSSNASFSQEIASQLGFTQSGDFESLETEAYVSTGSFIPATTGDYHLAFHATSPPNSGFILMFQYSISEILSTPDHNAGKVRLFPNPVSSELSIASQNAVDSVEIFNMLGQRVASNTFNTNEVRMNISDLSAGAYTVKVTSAGASQTMKIVKQ